MTDYTLDTLADLYATWRTQAAHLGVPMPCSLTMGMDSTHPAQDQPTYTWLPMDGINPAVYAAGLIHHHAPLWACLCADAVMGQHQGPGPLPPRGTATAAWLAGDDAVTEALVITWVSLVGTPVCQVRPYQVHGSTVVWDQEAVLDSRWDSAVDAVGGTVPTLLQHALHQARVGRN